jgi:hypothetical protein
LTWNFCRFAFDSGHQNLLCFCEMFRLCGPHEENNLLGMVV